MTKLIEYLEAITMIIAIFSSIISYIHMIKSRKYANSANHSANRAFESVTKVEIMIRNSERPK
jgi:hypothetical protein